MTNLFLAGQIPASIPIDLREWVDARTMIELCLDAVQTLDWSEPALKRRIGEGFQPQMMFTLLTYCYSVSLFGSEDVAWATMHDRCARYVAARATPEWRLFRRFRREHREALRQCLTYVIGQAWAQRFEQGDVHYLGYAWFESELNECIAASVEERLNLAVIMDRAADD